MRKVFMVAPYFTPRRKVGALRPFKFAIHLQSFGYQPYVLTIADSESTCTRREKELLEDIPIVSIEPPMDRTTSDTKSRSGNRGSEKLTSQLMDWIDQQTPMDTWVYLFLKNYFWIRKKAREIDPDIVWATGDPWSGLWLGKKIAKDLSLPFVADFRDPWTLSRIGLRKRSSFSEGIDQQIEKSIVQNASKLIYTSRLTENKYRDRYHLPEDKTETIYNSFDRTLLDEAENRSVDLDLNPDYLNLIFLGRFRRLSPVRPIVEALSELKERSSEHAEYIHIHSFGEPDAKQYSTIRNHGLERNFTFHPRVVPENVGGVLKNGDILLLSTSPERHEVIPAKLWDYLSVEIPILSIAPNPEVGEIIMRSKAGIQVNPDQTHELAEILKSFATAKMSGESLLLSPEKEIPDRNIYEAKTKTGELAALFDELLTDG